MVLLVEEEEEEQEDMDRRSPANEFRVLVCFIRDLRDPSLDLRYLIRLWYIIPFAFPLLEEWLVLEGSAFDFVSPYMFFC